MPSTASDSACASMDAQVLSNWLEGPAAMRPTTPAPSLPLHLTHSTQPDLTRDEIASLLFAFDVDIHVGFIPSPDPLPSLPLQSKFAPWERLMLDLSMRLHAHNIRQPILQLPLINVTDDDLPTPPELRRAQLVLSMLAHAYVWGEEPVVSRLPACIAVPWVNVSHRLGRVAVLTHSAIILSNWKRLDPKGPVRLHNVGLLNGFYGGIDEAIFYLVTLEVEAVGAPALAHMVQSQHYARTGQWTKLTGELRRVASFLPQMTAALMLTYTDCDPYIFYTRVRKFLQGWRGNPLIPEGMIYEGVSDAPQLFHGGSAAQSCILAVFDAFLSVQHEREQTRQFMRDMRFYMPGLHRHFLSYIDTNISVRQAVAEHCYGPHYTATAHPTPSTNGHQHLHAQSNGHSQFSHPSVDSQRLSSTTPLLCDPELLSAFNSIVDELVVLRTKHIGIVTTYILTQAHNVKQKIAPRPVVAPSLSLSPSPSPSLSTSHSTNSLHAVAATNGSLGSSPVSPRSPFSAVHADGVKADGDPEPEATGRSTGERGTGGTSIMPYLKTSRDETRMMRL